MVATSAARALLKLQHDELRRVEHERVLWNPSPPMGTGRHLSLTAHGEIVAARALGTPGSPETAPAWPPMPRQVKDNSPQPLCKGHRSLGAVLSIWTVSEKDTVNTQFGRFRTDTGEAGAHDEYASFGSVPDGVSSAALNRYRATLTRGRGERKAQARQKADIAMQQQAAAERIKRAALDAAAFVQRQQRLQQAQRLQQKGAPPRPPRMLREEDGAGSRERSEVAELRSLGIGDATARGRTNRTEQAPPWVAKPRAHARE